MTRFLRAAIGSLLAVAALLVTTIAIVMLIAMIVVWRQDGHLAAREWWTLRWSALAAVAGAACTWAGVRLTNGRRQLNEPREAFFRLTRTKSGRQERLLEAFSIYAFLAMLALPLWNCVPGGPARRGWQVAGWLAVIYLGIHLRVLLHELGHLGAARLLGLQPWTLRVGAGPVLWRGQTRAGFEWEWRFRPGGGYAESLYSSEGAFRRERFWVVLGGPVADGLLVMGGWLAWVYFGRPAVFPSTPPGAGVIALDAVALVTMLSMVAGLVPHRVYLGDRQLYTDGWWLLKTFSLPADKIKEWMYGQGYNRVVRLWKAGQRAAALTSLESLRAAYPDRAAALLAYQGQLSLEMNEPARAASCFRQALESATVKEEWRSQLQISGASALVAAWDLDGARDWCADLLARASSREERVERLDAFACLPLLHEGNRALLPDARRWCAEALALAPDRLTLYGTHGALLVEQDHCEEAWPILQDVFVKTTSEGDRGICAFYLALAAWKLGRPDELQRYRAEALRCCTVPALTKRLAAELPAA